MRTLVTVYVREIQFITIYMINSKRLNVRPTLGYFNIWL